MKRTIVLTSFNAVGAGQTATLDLPRGRRYFKLLLKYKDGTPNQAAIEADIPQIRLKINGKTQRAFSAAQLNAINALNGIAFQAGYMVIYLAEPWRRKLEGEEALAWGTADISNFQIEVDIAANANAPAIAAWAVVDNASAPIGAIVKWKVSTFTAAGAQVLNINSIPKTDAISRMHIFSALPTNVQVLVESLEILNENAAVMTQNLKDRGMTVQANTFPVVFDNDQQLSSALPFVKADGTGVNDFLVNVTTSGAGNLPILIESLGRPD